MRSNDAPNTSVSVTTLAVACDSSIFLSSKAKKKKILKKKNLYINTVLMVEKFKSSKKTSLVQSSDPWNL